MFLTSEEAYRRIFYRTHLFHSRYMKELSPKDQPFFYRHCSRASELNEAVCRNRLERKAMLRRRGDHERIYLCLLSSLCAAGCDLHYSKCSWPDRDVRLVLHQLDIETMGSLRRDLCIVLQFYTKDLVIP